MSPPFRTVNKNDVKISELVGLETYKALYTIYPNLYSYISDPLTPTNYFLTLVNGVITNSGMSKDAAGTLIYNTLSSLVNDAPNDIPLIDETLVQPLIGSSYTIKNLKSTFWENFILVVIVAFTSFFIIWYLYRVGFWGYVFNESICYDCMSVFDIFEF